jgi:hypothetical protein
MRLLMENETRHGAYRLQPQQQDRDSSYSNFLATHLPLFSEVMDPLEVDNWLRSTESKFRLLHFTKYQKTLYVDNNFEAQREPSGPPTLPHYQLIIKFHGVSSTPPSVAITYWWAYNTLFQKE